MKVAHIFQCLFPVSNEADVRLLKRSSINRLSTRPEFSTNNRTDYPGQFTEMTAVGHAFEGLTTGSCDVDGQDCIPSESNISFYRGPDVSRRLISVDARVSTASILRTTMGLAGLV